jgi:hypothetical protein
VLLELRDRLLQELGLLFEWHGEQSFLCHQTPGGRAVEVYRDEQAFIIERWEAGEDYDSTILRCVLEDEVLRAVRDWLLPSSDRTT